MIALVPPTIEQLAAEIERLKRRVADFERASGLYATNRELDSPNGDPIVKFGPRNWHGANHDGRHYSACEPDFLDQLAEMLAWSADHPKPGKEKYATYNRADARRARSWARRLRAASSNAEPAPTISHSETRERGAARDLRERPTVARGRADRQVTPDPETEDDFLNLKGSQ